MKNSKRWDEFQEDFLLGKRKEVEAGGSNLSCDTTKGGKGRKKRGIREESKGTSTKNFEQQANRGKKRKKHVTD